MKWVVVDTETTIRNRGEDAVGTMEASPHSPKNYVCYLGTGTLEDDYVGISTFTEKGSSEGVSEFLFNVTKGSAEVCLVGQNIVFDLLYFYKSCPPTSDIWRNVWIWDTQQVAYMLSGQTHTYPSLDSICEQYGLDTKPDKIKEYWKAGVDTPDIPEEEMRAYLTHDVLSTRDVFLLQWQEIQEMPEPQRTRFLNLVKVKMDDLLYTSVMQWNGMCFNKYSAKTESYKLAIALEEIRLDLVKIAQDQASSLDFAFNPDSPAHVSAVLFGGAIKAERTVNKVDEHGGLVVYKTGPRKGQPKTKKETYEIPVKGLHMAPPSHMKGASGYWPTGDDVLRKCADRDFFDPCEFSNLMLSYRELSKKLNTYFLGYNALAWGKPSSHFGNIHPSIHNCSTATGRQSHSNPNLQNVTRSDD